ncbi:MAG: hypothetical protein HY329_09520 [Chloroflexi bacterium]|nr:hypothetical protein [Chloroflexota bacterium]
MLAARERLPIHLHERLDALVAGDRAAAARVTEQDERDRATLAAWDLAHGVQPSDDVRQRLVDRIEALAL